MGNRHGWKPRVADVKGETLRCQVTAGLGLIFTRSATDLRSKVQRRDLQRSRHENTSCDGPREARGARSADPRHLAALGIQRLGPPQRVSSGGSAGMSGCGSAFNSLISVIRDTPWAEASGDRLSSAPPPSLHLCSPFFITASLVSWSSTSVGYLQTDTSPLIPRLLSTRSPFAAP